MKKIGITGGIASGKSEVCRIFSERFNVPVFYADIEAKILLQKNTHLQMFLSNLLGVDIFHTDGLVNTELIGKKLFENKSLLAKYEKKTHPMIQETFDKWATLQKSEYILYEAAILIEKQRQNQFDAILLVLAPHKTRFFRIKKRNPVWSEPFIQTRIDSQWPNKRKIAFADLLIYNKENNLDILEKKVKRIHKLLSK